MNVVLTNAHVLRASATHAPPRPDYGNTEKSSKATPRLHLGDEESSVGSGENFEIPVVLMTLGWDPSGDPTHSERLRGRDRTCTYRVLEMERVVRWFTSHTRYDTHTDEKVLVSCLLPTFRC